MSEPPRSTRTPPPAISPPDVRLVSVTVSAPVTRSVLPDVPCSVKPLRSSVQETETSSVAEETSCRRVSVVPAVQAERAAESVGYSVEVPSFVTRTTPCAAGGAGSSPGSSGSSPGVSGPSSGSSPGVSGSSGVSEPSPVSGSPGVSEPSPVSGASWFSCPSAAMPGASASEARARAGAKEIKHKISAAKSAASSMMIATERFVLIRIPPSKTGPARLSPSGSPTL